MSLGPRHMSLLESYFSSLATFSQDRARDLVCQERDSLRHQAAPPSYIGLLGLLAQLAGAEKQYLGLTFLQSRSSVFLRKEPSLRLVLQTLQAECARIGEGGSLAGEVAKVVGQLVELRGVLVEVYERLATTSFSPGELAASLTKVVERVGGEPDHGVTRAWARVVSWETGSLVSCLSALSSMETWDLFSSLLQLQQAGEHLAAWEQAVGARREATRKLSFASSLLRGVVAGSTEPHLYLWLQKLKAGLLSKFSLYFHSHLARQAPPQELRLLCSKLGLDQSNRLALAQKKLDTQTICLMFDASGLEGKWSGVAGYRHLGRQTSPLSGLDLFPLVFSTPGPPPAHHLPNLVMLVTDQASELGAGRIVHLYDPGVGSTYFLAQVETNFHLIIVCEGRRGERDSAVTTFMQETGGQLRCTRLFASLKPGSK